ncbi:MAG: hypothetical protein ACFBSG_19190 [Leptolyngbyaceae cyanobacterium]
MPLVNQQARCSELLWINQPGVASPLGLPRPAIASDRAGSSYDSRNVASFQPVSLGLRGYPRLQHSSQLVALIAKKTNRPIMMVTKAPITNHSCPQAAAIAVIFRIAAAISWIPL